MRLGQPAGLEAPCGNGGRRVAAENDQFAAAREQALDGDPRQLDDLLGGPVAVGDVGVVAEVDERKLGEAPCQRGKNGKPAEAGVEDTYHGAPCVMGPLDCREAAPGSTFSPGLKQSSTHR
jgi:hypothetical protein